MGTIGSWWVASHEQQSGEEQLESYHANYWRPDGRPLGGKLYLTDQRLLFSPHLLDAALGGSKHAIAVHDIERICVTDDSHPDSEGDDSPTPPANSLHLELAGGAETFVVTDPETVATEIRALL